MDHSRVKQLVGELLPWMRWALQLQEWDIGIELGPIDPNRDGDCVVGRCAPDPRYRRASIMLNPAKIEDDEELATILRHELLHVFHARFVSYRRQVGQNLGRDAMDTLDETYQDAIEEMVGMIERALDHGLGMTPARMIQEARRHQKRKDKR